MQSGLDLLLLLLYGHTAWAAGSGHLALSLCGILVSARALVAMTRLGPLRFPFREQLFIGLAGLSRRTRIDSSRNMETASAVASLSALAHPSRLDAFRLLVREGAPGLAAGEISERLAIPPPTLSFHLSRLVRAGLVDSRREGRSVLYSLRVEGIRELLGFVTEDCCQGRPELCAPSCEPGVEASRSGEDCCS